MTIEDFKTSLPLFVKIACCSWFIFPFLHVIISQRVFMLRSSLRYIGGLHRVYFWNNNTLISSDSQLHVPVPASLYDTRRCELHMPAATVLHHRSSSASLLIRQTISVCPPRTSLCDVTSWSFRCLLSFLWDACWRVCFAQAVQICLVQGCLRHLTHKGVGVVR